MSRVGKKPVVVPSGVTAAVEGQTLTRTRPTGLLHFVGHDDVEV
jgi:large subunit ribosomal protein L6